MAVQNNAIPGSGYGNVYLDSLIWGDGWSGSPIRYWFGAGAVAGADSSIGAFTGISWSNSEKNAFEQALSQYSSICNINFIEASSADAADTDIVWWLAPNSAMPGYLGMHEVPDESYQPIYGYFNAEETSWQNLDVGAYGYVTIIHELGHALGLAHPHDGGSEATATKFPGVTSAFGSYGKNNLNQGIWTTMSYNDGWIGQPSNSYAFGWQGAPMALDIAALQAIYGANTNTATGDDTYLLPDSSGLGTYWSCIWDADGDDTISNAGSSGDSIINLNSAPLIGVNAGGYISWVKSVPGGYTIANGVVIENAVGGLGNDELIGNGGKNVLDGGAGADSMKGGSGDDIYYVDNVMDKVIELSNNGVDAIWSASSLTLMANVENLYLEDGAGASFGNGNGLANLIAGNSYANQMSGGAGSDKLIGGGGGDELTGGKGADLFVYEDISDSGVGAGLRDVVKDFSSRQGDKLDLSAFDAISSTGSDDSFIFIGSAGFTAAGQLRYENSILSGNVTGSGAADFEIMLSNGIILTGAMIVL